MKNFKKYGEWLFWIAALVSLMLMNPEASTHFSFCILKILGFHFCPGCGLAHSISFLFHGKLDSSLQAHPLGVLALIVIIFRIKKLSSYLFFSPFKNLKHAS